MKKVYKQAEHDETIENINDDITVISEEVHDDLKLLRKEDKPKKSKIRIRKWMIVVCIFVGLLISVGICYGYFLHLIKQGEDELLGNETQLLPHNSVISDDGKSMSYKGASYKRNDNIVSFLIMGIDDIEGDNDTKQVGNKGQADTIFYGTLDVSNGELKFLNISRDTMVDVDLYDTDGDYAKTEKKQICLAYAYGSDDVQSSQNVMTSATRLLFNAPIDFYVSIDFPAVSVLTDSVGGVKVKVLEDLSAKDSMLKKGETVVLNGKQSMIYVRSRDFDTLDSNNNRMLRQKQYVVEFLKKVQSLLRTKPYVVLNLYQVLQEYMTTDLNLSKTLYLSNYAFKNQISSDMVKTVKGTVKQGEKYAEYYVDEDDLYQQLLDMLYIQEGSSEPMNETESETENIVETEASLQKVDFSYLY